MLTLPRALSAQLIDLTGRAVRAPDILLQLNLLKDDKPYYACLLGLTDDNGSAQLEGSDIQRRYARDQSLFPMDYRLELSSCDPVVEVELVNAERIRDVRAQLGSLSYIEPNVAEAYRRARNGQFRASSARLPIRDVEASRSLVQVVASAALNHA